MDSDRFDSLTRTISSRRAVGGAIAGVVAGLIGRNETEAARCPKGKKRCGKRCIPRRGCCRTAQCRPGVTGEICRRNRCVCPAGQRSCRTGCLGKEGASCTGFETCCSKSCDFLVGGGTCSSCSGGFCSSEADCCPGTPCVGNRCGGCLPRATVCTPGGQPCCESECSLLGSTNVCLSSPGQRCKHDANCRNCYIGDDCLGNCIGGICQR
jgi:hypothetical protein